MATWVALFRGINVVGKNIVPMRELAAMFESLGFHSVRTYIQSGNVVFASRAGSASTLESAIAAGMLKHFNLKPAVIVLRVEEIESAIRANPFPDATGDAARLHLAFLASRADAPDLAKLTQLASPTERFQLKDRVLYVHAPDGFGPSKLAAGAERAVGVPITFRNWRTVTTLGEMAAATPERRSSAR